MAVRVENDLIAEIASERELLDKYPAEDTLDAHGQFLMPGLICAHTHFYGVFSRGMAIHGETPADFPEILRKLWWPLDQSLTHEDVYYSSMVCLIDAIKHGTTTLFDHHASPNCISGSLDVIEKAVREAGVRASLCYEVTDRGGIEKANEGIQENIRFINKIDIRGRSDSLITASFGLHAGLTLSKETLEKSLEAIPAGYGFHVHVAEHQSDEFDSLNKSGKRVIDRLMDAGITGNNSIFVHGVHLDARELLLLKDRNTWLTHQPRSNMNNAVGMADTESALRLGIPVCIGNDGFSFTMWDEWRSCYLAHKLWKRDPRSMNGANVIRMGAINNARMASHFFNAKIGTIEVGAKADLILVEYLPITPISVENLPWHILFGFRDSMVTTTMVNGKLLMRDRKLLFIDETEITNIARENAILVWGRYQNQFKDK
jgi:putative selenium metabolism protein SsnA